MFTRLQTLNFRCLRHVDLKLKDFHVLVGANASGKTTFLDVIGILGDLVRNDLSKAMGNRSSNFNDLIWARSGNFFEVAVEARIPEVIREKVSDKIKRYDTVRYELRIELNESTQELGLRAERLLAKVDNNLSTVRQLELFPSPLKPPKTILYPDKAAATKTIIKKVAGGNDNYYSETGKSYNPSFRLGPQKSALANLPADEANFPISTWWRDLLSQGIQNFVLNSLLIRQASPPGQGTQFSTDGSNMPWVIDRLKNRSPERFELWLDHVRSALPDLSTIRVIDRKDDRHKYIMLRYANGIETPSWTSSDGTLRLLALTIPAYLSDVRGIYLIEEPENGIHPKAVETVLQSLSSVYDAQVILASHSPIILGLVKPGDVLCFSKDEKGATDIVSGNEHPALKNWTGSPDFNVLFASGILS